MIDPKRYILQTKDGDYHGIAAMGVEVRKTGIFFVNYDTSYSSFCLVAAFAADAWLCFAEIKPGVRWPFELKMRWPHPRET